MLSTYRGRPLEPAIGLFFSIPKATIELRKDCYLKDGWYYSILKWKGNKISLGVFKDADKCNEAWDLALTIRQIKARAPAVKGYTAHPLKNGKTLYKISITVNRKTRYVTSCHNEAEARSIYLHAFEDERQKQLKLLK